MSDDKRQALASAKRRRGVVRGSITRLERRVIAFETKADLTHVDHLAIQRLIKKFETLDAEFREHHYAIVELLEPTALDDEQAILDDHDEGLTDLVERLQQLVLVPDGAASGSAPGPADASKPLQKQLERIEKRIRIVNEKTAAIHPGPKVDQCLLRQLEEEAVSLKTELADTGRAITLLETGGDALMEHEATLNKTLFETGLQIKHLLAELPVNKPAPAVVTGVKLPKIDVPTFDGNLLHWGIFWEQFRATVHSRSHLSDADKLAYLQQALRDGTAKHVIEGLTRSAGSYREAIVCLLKRYDRPRLIHQAHVRAIIEAAPLKEGHGRELRRLHDVANQHLRALKAMDYDPSGPFITSLLELKLDQTTVFEWQRHSQATKRVPHYQELLDFLDLRAQASEAIPKVDRKSPSPSNRIPYQQRPSYVTSANDSCAACKNGKHPLYTCKNFREMSHEQKMAIVKDNGLCLNCLKPGHFVKKCPSDQHCRRCRNPHHSLMHIETEAKVTKAKSPTTSDAVTSHASHSTNCYRQVLLMTCKVQVVGPNGYSTYARALLDSASSTSFISERLAQHLRLPRTHRSFNISGIGGINAHSASRGMVRFNVTHFDGKGKVIPVDAVVLSTVTTDLPTQPVAYDHSWKHLMGLRLADPDFGKPGRIDMLLGADIFSQSVCHGRRYGPAGAPTAFSTCFGWVLAGSVRGSHPQRKETACFASSTSCDSLLKKFWEVEDCSFKEPSLSMEERAVMEHFEVHHYRDETGRFVVPLPRKPHVAPLGESRSIAVKRFLTAERSLKANGKSREFADSVLEYFELDHAEPVPASDLGKPWEDVFYMPMHAVTKSSSTTSRLRVVFDASAKTKSGTSLNDHLLVGPTVHPPLVDVLLRFRRHRIALVADISKMYRAVLLPDYQRDLHRFVWRDSPNEPLVDYRMKRLTFGVSASSFAANMAVRQNALDNTKEYPLASKAILDSFYVDDALAGEDTVEDAVELQMQLQQLSDHAGFTLRKWNSNIPAVLTHIPPHLRAQEPCCSLGEVNDFVKVLGIEWNAELDSFRPIIATNLIPSRGLTKRALTSDIARVYDILGWCSPAVVKLKILLQKIWKEKLDWDELVSPTLTEVWERWRSELTLLQDYLVPRYYLSGSTKPACVQLHGFCDASESAYAAAVYIRVANSEEDVRVTIVMAKTKVAPIKRLTIPRLELCGALILARMIHHVAEVLEIDMDEVYTWTDSTVVLGWLRGNPNRFKTFVGNRVSEIIDLVSPSHWNHVSGTDNPADPASRGLYPGELVGNELWWQGPGWLYQNKKQWPSMPELPDVPIPSEERGEQQTSLLANIDELSLLEGISTYSRLKRVTAWLLRFINNCRSRHSNRIQSTTLTTDELLKAEQHWIRRIQRQEYGKEITTLEKENRLPRSSKLLPLHPIMDKEGLLRVGGRMKHAGLFFHKRHPVILPGSHTFTKLLVRSEHQRLLHAGPTLVTASLSRRFYIVKGRRMIRSVIHACVRCRRVASRPKPQILGQLPADRLHPGPVFDRVGVDYAGPFLIKSGPVRKPTIRKAYVAVFVCFSIKAVHLEVVSDLTTAAFLATLRRFIARRGKPSIIWSDHGTNFVGAAREIKELYNNLRTRDWQRTIVEYCAIQNVQWKFTPEQAPHFGGLWEAAVKSFKSHLKKVVGETRLTFEELTTITAQIEACLNSRPLTPLPEASDNLEVLTPGHFLTGRPLEALPDSPSLDHDVPILRRWNLCQAVVRHFWKRWSAEYLCHLQRFGKWNVPTRNYKVGDIVCVREESLFPTKWPLARVIQTHPGQDGKVRVVTIQTQAGIYKRPIVKIVPLVCEDQ